MCNVHLVPPDILAGWGRQDIFLTVVLPLAIIAGMLPHAMRRARKVENISTRRGVLRLSIASLVCILLAVITIFDLAGPWGDAITEWQSKPFPDSCSYDAIEAVAAQARLYANLLSYLGFVLFLAGGILEARAQVKYNAARSAGSVT